MKNKQDKRENKILSKKDLNQHVWLALAVRNAKHTLELEREGFNYFSRSKEHKPLAWKLKRLS